jgi:hypothetical protein
MELDINTVLEQIAGANKEKALARQIRNQAAQPNLVLQGANQRGSALDMLNFAATAGSNNEGLANAVSALVKSRRASSAPVKMGESGFAIPDTGQFIENPNYTQEKDDARSQSLVQALMAMQERARMAAEGNEIKREAIQQRADASSERSALLRSMQALKGEVSANKPAKPLPYAVVKDINKLDVTGATESLLNTFTDKDAVAPVIGGIANEIGRTSIGKMTGIGSSEDTANWWQNYNDMKNLYRNTLFGSALTKSEKQAFDAANIKEGDSPNVIRTRLAQQHQAAVRAYNKLVANAGKAGYDTQEFMKPDFQAPLPGNVGAGTITRTGPGVGNSAPKSPIDDILKLYPPRTP